MTTMTTGAGPKHAAPRRSSSNLLREGWALTMNFGLAVAVAAITFLAFAEHGVRVVTK